MTTTFIPAHGLPTSVKAKFSGRSRSSFYYKRKRATKDQEEAAKLKTVHDVHPYYGHRRLALATKMNKKKVRRLMRRFSLCARTSHKRRAKNQYTQLKTSLPNRLKDIELTSPDQVWAGDFTHVTFQRKTYYFATVIDAYTREVIGWHVAGSHSVELVLEALRMAVKKRRKMPDLFHSDHGSEYLSDTYITELRKNGITPSNSQKGKPWQNGVQESFYNRFKDEFGDPDRFVHYEKFFEGLGQYLAAFNLTRIHTSLKMAPRAFYERWWRGREGQPEGSSSH